MDTTVKSQHSWYLWLSWKYNAPALKGPTPLYKLVQQNENRHTFGIVSAHHIERLLVALASYV